MTHKEYLSRMFSILEATRITSHGQTLEWEDGFEHIIELFRRLRTSGQCVYFIGNGGSAAIAEHMLTDFMKNGRTAFCDTSVFG